ncbi:undecaprenyl-diphosphate phosphatase [Ectothiorhodospiraceae bacterium 2226]|nr:undecaprenyl-diphosphate phosphatase [Ectothiorhodospiraceae bacterium 2226]
MDLLQTLVLAVVQGLTEFLPISSSAHLILVPVLTAWEDQGLAFDVATHVGTLSAVVFYFRHELLAMSRDWTRSLVTREITPDAKLAWWVLLGTIPVGLAGLAFRDVIAEGMRSPLIMAWALIGFGLLLGWADWRHRTGRNEHSLSVWDMLFIGCAQALALIPGTSRSGITITAALLLGLSREAAARFSFLLSIPVIVLAGGLETVHLIRLGEPVPWGAMLIGAVVAGISAYLTIYYFIAFIKRIGMQPFVAYRIVLGLVLLYLFWPNGA